MPGSPLCRGTTAGSPGQWSRIEKPAKPIRALLISGGNAHDQKIVLGPGYQVPFSAAIRRAAGASKARGYVTHNARFVPDVAQLNGFHPGLRKAIIETVGSIAGQCDGMRCDMAMLLMTPIFERTWGNRAGLRPEKEYWPEVIQGVRKRYPDVLFMAEAYWDKEWELQQQGFDYCYDKRLYDRLEHGPAESVRLHLCADLPYQEKLVRFIENHDEPRAAATFVDQQARAAAVTSATLPGARLFHEGQFEGRRVRLPVFLRRRPDEAPDRDLQGFYHALLQTLRSKDVRDGEWKLCERTGWPDNDSYLNVVAWCWQQGADRHLIVVNLSEVRSQTRVKLPWTDLNSCSWRLTDPLQMTFFDRAGDELQASGLYVDLEPWGYHVLHCEHS